MFLHFSAKKVECAKHQWIHLVGDQPESPHAFENFVVNARWHSTWVRVYISLTLQSSYKPSISAPFCSHVCVRVIVRTDFVTRTTQRTSAYALRSECVRVVF